MRDLQSKKYYEKCTGALSHGSSWQSKVVLLMRSAVEMTLALRSYHQILQQQQVRQMRQFYNSAYNPPLK